MSRGELAEAVCAWLWETTGVDYDLDGHYVAKLERGVVRWPGAAYRSGLRHVLDVATDNELGFSPAGRAGSPDADHGISSAIGLDDELVRAGEESVGMLPLAEESNVGELTVEQLHADIQRVSQQYLKVPTKALFLRTRAIRDQAFQLLTGRQSPQQTRELYSVAGWALALLGWMAVDLGRSDLAQNHCRTAWACAEAADNSELRGWVRATQRTAVFWQDDFARAADHAAAGLQLATGSSRLYLASALAVDLARTGRVADARAALAAAKQLADRPGRHEFPGPFLCTPERAEGLWSHAHLALGQARETLEHADRGVALSERAPMTLRNLGTERMIRLQQVKAHLELGELDGALETIAPVLRTPAEYRVRPLIHRIGEIGAMTRTERFAGEAKAAQLQVAVRAFVHRPATGARRRRARTQPA